MSIALDRVREAGGAELAERLVHLDRARAEGARRAIAPVPAPDRAATPDFDVVIAGGGLWSLLAPLLAARGLSVAVVDRARIGAAHREWNASGPELEALVRTGLLDAPALERLVVARYRYGTCRFHRGGTYPVTDVLDHAVDAGALLRLGRAASEARGVTLLDHHAVVGEAAGPSSVRVRTASGGRERDLVARVLVDARGAASPYASADLVCPTVGGVLGGLAEGDGPDEIDPGVGEILATVDDEGDDGRQHVWEAFPGSPGETTVYVFYYARATERASLVDLYDRFFATLPSYKRGDARLVRPTFGFIPGWSRLTPPPRPPHPRVLLVGDAAARQSPLTYCGFGAALRSLAPCEDAVVRAVEHGRAPDLPCVDDAPVHALTGALAHVMASRGMPRGDLNALLDAAFSTLHEMGPGPYQALLRDEMAPAHFTDFLRRTAGKRARVWHEVPRTMGLGAAGRWLLAVVRSALSAPRAAGGAA